MKKVVLAILIAGLMLAAVIGTLSGSAADASERMKVKPVDPSNNEGSLDDPLITLDPPEPNGGCNWYISAVTVTFHAKEGQGPGITSGLKYIYYRINEGSWITHEIPGEYPNLPDEYDFFITIDNDGEFTVDFKAEDWVGNMGQLHSSGEFRIDMTAPTITITKEKISTGKIKFTADASDAMSGIYYVKFDSEPSGELPDLPHTDTTSPYEWTFTGIRNYKIKATAYDFAGNHAESNILSTPRGQSQSSDSPESTNLQSPVNQFLQRIVEPAPQQFTDQLFIKLLQGLVTQFLVTH